MLKDVGTIEAGKQADFVLLGAEPPTTSLRPAGSEGLADMADH